jgi:glycosyltransferase involved in cell wall biosynthesis
MNRIKVAIATHFPKDPNEPHGGVESVSVNLVRWLASLDDLEVHVVTLDSDTSQTETFDWQNARIHRLPRGPGGQLRNAIFRGRAQLHEFLRLLRPDVVHAHDIYGLMTKGLNIPRVFTIHGFIYGDILVSDTYLPRSRSAVWRYFETSGWADQPRIISISPYVRERLGGIYGGTIYDIDNPIGEGFFGINRSERTGIVFSAASICPRKNTLNLVRAASEVLKSGIEIQLRLAGPITNNRYGEQVHTAIHECGLENNVTLLNQIGTDQIMEELASASVFALVSLEENSPMGIEEAMAAGVPVLTSNRCGMPYMVSHGESGYLVDPNNIENIAARLAMLLSDPARRSEMGDKARAIAAARFHPRLVALKTRDVYLESIGGIQAAPKTVRTEKQDPEAIANPVPTLDWAG